MADLETPAVDGPPAQPGRLARWLGGFRIGYLSVLITYFCYGASAVTAVATLYFEKDVLGLTPAEAAGIAFWLGLPWSMKMVAGVASDVFPIAGSRRSAYLLLGALCSAVGYAALASSAPNEDTLKTVIREGATIGAGAVIGPGVSIGAYAMIGMGAVVVDDVPAYALAYGNPARERGRVCVCGLPARAAAVGMRCPRCGRPVVQEERQRAAGQARTSLRAVP